jgi:hypothetical protein
MSNSNIPKKEERPFIQCSIEKLQINLTSFFFDATKMLKHFNNAIDELAVVIDNIDHVDGNYQKAIVDISALILYFLFQAKKTFS